jgi:hypothetical protein
MVNIRKQSCFIVKMNSYLGILSYKNRSLFTPIRENNFHKAVEGFGNGYFAYRTRYDMLRLANFP